MNLKRYASLVFALATVMAAVAVIVTNASAEEETLAILIENTGNGVGLPSTAVCPYIGAMQTCELAVTNKSTVAVKIKEIKITGPHAGRFSRNNGCTVTAELAVNASCNEKITLSTAPDCASINSYTVVLESAASRTVQGTATLYTPERATREDLK